MSFEFLLIPGKIVENLGVVWTFILLVVRFTALLIVIPGLGQGLGGTLVRTPAILVLAFSSMFSSPLAQVPENWTVLVLQIASEFALGAVLGLIPLLIVSGVQTAGYIASTTMGLQASQLIDPTLHISIPDIARVYGDLVVVMFLLTGGHHVAVHAAAGLGGQLIPGTFVPAGGSFGLLLEKSGDVFRLGVMLSGPVIVALLLTNFVMGLITKAVPTVNIFIVSFPLTIGIGLILSALVLPELVQIVTRELLSLESSALTVLNEARLSGT